MHIHTCVPAVRYMYVHTHTPAAIYMYISMYALITIYIYIHTNKYTHKKAKWNVNKGVML